MACTSLTGQRVPAAAIALPTGGALVSSAVLVPAAGLPAQPNLGQPGMTLQYGIFKNPALNLLNFSIPPYREKIVAASRLLDSTNPDLSAFFARGGKLIVKSNAADYSVNPQAMYHYHDALIARLG